MERNEDYVEVENLVRNSFWNIYRPGAFEHYIVHNLRGDDSFIRDLAYVIEDNGKISGHINYSRGCLNYGDEKTDAILLGPIAIHENFQKQGLGSRLIEYTIDLVQDNYPFVFVIGDENYYHGFGFESASKYDMYLGRTDFNDECAFFMIKIFNRYKLKNKRAIFKIPDVFNVKQEDVDEFDKQFEHKQKLQLNSQLQR